jgi:hypothetical protein
LALEFGLLIAIGLHRPPTGYRKKRPYLKKAALLIPWRVSAPGEKKGIRSAQMGKEPV